MQASEEAPFSQPIPPEIALNRLNKHSERAFQ